MLVSRWGNSLAVRLPKDVVDKLGLKEGDNLLAEDVSDMALTLRKDDEKRRRRAEAFERLKDIRLPLPPGYTFSRDDIYDQPRGGKDEDP